MMIQLGLGLDARPVSDGGTVPDIPSGQPTITVLPFDGYVFDAAGGNAATVTLRGTGEANAPVQARGASVGGNTSWGATTSDGSGNWSVTIAVPDTQWGNWYTPNARYGATGGVATSAITFGCGDVIGFMGQSELAYFTNLGSAFNPMTYPTLSAQNMTVLLQDNITGAITPTRITTVDNSTVNMGLLAIANVLDHVLPNRKVMVLDMSHQGSARTELMDDANTARNFTYLSDLVAMVRSGGSDVGLIVENWYNSDASSINDIGLNFGPWYFGQRWGGGTFTLGTVNPDNNVNPAVIYDHCLWDVEVATDLLGRGLFARGRTKLVMMGPMPFHDTPIDPAAEWDNFTGTGPRMVEPVRENIRAFIEDARVQTFCIGYGSSTHLTDFGGSIHPLPDDTYGTVQFALDHVPALLDYMGHNVTEPTITDIEEATDGSYADVVVSLPNGGTLDTIRSNASIADPLTLPPHFQDVVGFEITRAGGSRRPVFGLSETDYPAAHRGTVAIQDAGSGDPRVGRVRITPAEPFGTGDQVSYLLGQASASLQEPRDTDAKLHLNMLIEHVPALYDAADIYPLRGVPVGPQVYTPAIQLPAAPFTARGAAFDGATNYVSTSISVPVGSQGLTSFWFRNRDSAWNAISGARLFQFRVGFTTVLEINTVSSGRMQFRLLQDGTGSDVWTSPSNTFTLNQWHHIAWAWDFAASTFQIYVDGVALDTSGYSFGVDGFTMGGGNFSRIGIASTVTSSNRWLGDIGHLLLDTNGTLDLNIPANLAKFISGGAPVNLGQMGDIPTGSVPQYYYDGDGAAWANLGSAGNVPLNGLITTSDLAPSL